MKKITNARNILIIFCLTVVVAIALRTYQLMFAIDYNTGFFIEGSVVVIILQTLLVVSLAVQVLLVLLWKTPTEYRKTIRKDYSSLAVTSVVVAIMMFLQAIIGSFYTAMSANPVAGVQAADISKRFAIEDFVAIGLLVMTGISFLYYAASLFRENKKNLGLLLLFPIIFACFHLMRTFMQYTTIANISDNLFDIITLLCATVFVYMFVRSEMGYGTQISEKMIIVSGIMTATFGLLSALSKYIVIILSLIFPAMKVSAGANMADIAKHVSAAYPNVAELAFSLFALILIIKYLVGKMKQATSEKRGI